MVELGALLLDCLVQLDELAFLQLKELSHLGLLELVIVEHPIVLTGLLEEMLLDGELILLEGAHNIFHLVHGLLLLLDDIIEPGDSLGRGNPIISALVLPLLQRLPQHVLHVL